MSCPYPTVRFVAYEGRKTWGKVFIPDPSLRGRYILTHPCVTQVPCPQCRSMVNEPCQGRQGYGAGTHVVRQYAAKRYRGIPVNDVIAIEEPEENFDWEAFQ